MRQFFRQNYFLIITIILAAALRLYNLSSNPPSLDWDEASLGYNAYSILKTGADEYGNFLPFSIRSFNDYKPPLYTYLTVPSVAIFGLTEFAVRLPSALAGIIAVIATFYLVLELFKNYKHSLSLAQLSSLLLAISPWHLQFSRGAFEANLALTLYILSVTFFLKWIDCRQNKPKINLSSKIQDPRSKFQDLQSTIHILLSSFTASASLYSYHSARLVVPLMFIFLAFIYRNNLLKNYKQTIIALIFAVLLLSPLAYISTKGYTTSRLDATSILGNPDGYGREVERIDRLTEFDQTDDLVGKFIPYKDLGYAQIILRNYFEHFNFNFLFLSGDGNPRHSASGMGHLYFIELPLLIYGAYKLIDQKQNAAKIIWLWIFVGPLAASITKETPHAIRSLMLLPAFQIITAYGIVTLYQKSKDIKNKSIKLLLYSLFTITYSLFIITYLNLYHVITPYEHSQGWQYGYRQMVTKVTELESDYDQIIISNLYDQPHIYLAFYQKIDPKTYQTFAETAGQSFGKYTFTNQISDLFKESETKSLFVATPWEINIETSPIHQINFLDGTPAFLLYSLP